MNTSRRLIVAISATVSVISTAACAMTSVTSNPQNAPALRWQGSSLSRAPLLVRHRAKGPLATSLRSQSKASVLFVTDAGAGETYMFDLATLALAGTITGFVQPQGECADSKGNVWIADTAAQTVYEVSHEGRLENELTDTSYPLSCAWDATTGDLAVTDQLGPNGGNGNVAIYKNGAYSIAYMNAKVFYYNFAAYDANGNLFVDGRTSSGAFALMKVPKGSTKMQVLKVTGGKIYFPGMVQWDKSANDLIVGDQSCRNAYASCLHTLSVQQIKATITSTISLQDSGGGTVCDLVQGDVYGGRLFGSDYDFCGSQPSTTYAWPYPVGGAPTLSNATVDSAPIGAVVSP